MLKSMKRLGLVLACALAAAPASAVETARGVLPPGPAAPAGFTVWEFASGRDEQQVTTFLYLTDAATSFRLRMTPADPAIRAIEVYANGTLSARFDQEGSFEDRKARGFQSGDGPAVNLTRGLRRGLNRITFLPRFAADIEDSVDHLRPAWSGIASFSTGRLVELTLLFRGLERVFDMEAKLYRALRYFDHEIRVGHPLEPQFELVRRLEEVEGLRKSLARDRSVALALAEADRLYLESWKEPGAGGKYLGAQLAAGREIAHHWGHTAPLWVAHEIYRSARRKASMYEALTDVSLSRENLRNACAVLATRSGETAPEALKTLLNLMQQDQILTENLDRQATAMAQELAVRRAEILKTFPRWREQFLGAYHAVIRFRKVPPPDYPSRAVVDHETDIVVKYLDELHGLCDRDLGYGRILSELTATLVEPRDAAVGLPRRTW